MSTYDETVALCALNKIFGYHPHLALDLMEQNGSALALFDGKLAAEAPVQEAQYALSSAKNYADATGNTSRPPAITSLLPQLVPSQLEWAAKELEKVQGLGCRFISIMDDDYPSALRECPGPPLGLYMKASSSPAEIFGLRPMVAFVGTRDLSPYGKAWCSKLVKAIAEAHVQPSIVSGLALGTDGVAHRTALDWRWGPTAWPTGQRWIAVFPPSALWPRESMRFIPGNMKNWHLRW